MSQQEFTHYLEALSHENLQLLQHIDYLESRLTQYEDVPTIEETLAMAGNEHTVEDEWGIWPYSWATSAWSTTAERLHSFHKSLRKYQVSKPNERLRRGFQNPNCEQSELTLT